MYRVSYRIRTWDRLLGQTLYIYRNSGKSCDSRVYLSGQCTQVPSVNIFTVLQCIDHTPTCHSVEVRVSTGDFVVPEPPPNWQPQVCIVCIFYVDAVGKLAVLHASVRTMWRMRRTTRSEDRLEPRQPWLLYSWCLEIGCLSSGPPHHVGRPR